jgi:hypothetical protein
MDTFLSVIDASGSKAERMIALSPKKAGEEILLRLDKAVYKAGETLSAEILTTGGKGTVFIDITRGRQTVLTKTVDVANGRGLIEFNLTPDLFGSIEVHAYLLPPSGEMMRDTRVIYAQPATDLNIKIEKGKETYLPGEEGVRIKFLVTDTEGRAAQSALGIIIVDESVYALQEMQPGLEKIYFTLEAELAKPMVEICNHPFSMERVVSERELKAARQDAARVILASARPVTDFNWTSNPAKGRRAKFSRNLQAIRYALYYYINGFGEFAEKDADTGKWGFKTGLIGELIKKKKYIKEANLKDPLDKDKLLTMKSLESFGAFAFDKWLAADTARRKQYIWQRLYQYVRKGDIIEGKKGAYTFKKDVLESIIKDERYRKDATGEKITLEKLAEKEKAFSTKNIARMTAQMRKQAIWNALWQRIHKGKCDFITFDNDKKTWVFTTDAEKKLGLDKAYFRAPGGDTYSFTSLAKKHKAFEPDNLMGSGRTGSRIFPKTISSSL